MANTVFANSLEVSCKISGGKSVAAFPDPCWSPPSPPAGPVVIPYANTAYAKDLANGTSSVFIGGKPVARKDQSFLSTSTGNEGATRSFAQGVTTGTIKGKAYYTSWSMNVMVEGYNVPRHTDLMTHNHGSQPGNTGGWAYVSTASEKAACKEDIERVEKKCGVDEKDNKKFRKKQEKRNHLRKKRGKKARRIRDLTWKDKHCKLLAIKPGIQSLKSAEKKFNTALSDARDDLLDVAKNAGVELAQNAAEDWAVRSLEKELAGLGCTALSPLATLVCESVITLYNAGDAAVTAFNAGMDLWEKRGIIEDMTGYVDQIKGYLKDIKKVHNALEAGKDSAEYQKLVEKLKDQANDMKMVASVDPCIRARKCMLVPYNNKKKQDKTSINKGKIGKLNLFGDMFGDQRGCCSGQTGHHLLPDSWAKNACSKSKYRKNNAPVVCAEGVDNATGSHGDIHDALDERVKDFWKTHNENATISMDEAINMAAESHGEGLIGHCDEKCIKAQLKHYYSKCGCGNFKPSTKSQKNTGTYTDSSNNGDIK